MEGSNLTLGWNLDSWKVVRDTRGPPIASPLGDIYPASSRSAEWMLDWIGKSGSFEQWVMFTQLCIKCGLQEMKRGNRPKLRILSLLPIGSWTYEWQTLKRLNLWDWIDGLEMYVHFASVCRLRVDILGQALNRYTKILLQSQVENQESCDQFIFTPITPNHLTTWAYRFSIQAEGGLVSSCNSVIQSKCRWSVFKGL